MSDHLSHEDYLRSSRAKAVEIAKAMLAGEISFLEGARAIRNPLRDGEDPECENAFKAFTLIYSDTDSLPVTDRRFWSSEALQKLEPELAAAELWAREIGTEPCKIIISRLASNLSFNSDPTVGC